MYDVTNLIHFSLVLHSFRNQSLDLQWEAGLKYARFNNHKRKFKHFQVIKHHIKVVEI